MTIVRSGPVTGEGIDKIFGFESIVEKMVENTNLPSGNPNLDGDPVGAGKIWKITHVSCTYDGTVPDRLEVYVSGLATSIRLIDVSTIAAGQWYFWTGEIYMQKDDFIRLHITNSTLHNDAYLMYAGVQMNAP